MWACGFRLSMVFFFLACRLLVPRYVNFNVGRVESCARSIWSGGGVTFDEINGVMLG